MGLAKSNVTRPTHIKASDVNILKCRNQKEALSIQTYEDRREDRHHPTPMEDLVEVNRWTPNGGEYRSVSS